MKFWAACKLSKGDYLQVKEKLFTPETVASLYAKIKESGLTQLAQCDRQLLVHKYTEFNAI